VQWAAGLELFLLIKNPGQVFFTTDHPNGAPFTTYPEIFALIMSKDERTKRIADLPKEALELSTLPAIEREYSFSEIATMTRVAPAKLLGLKDRGHLAAGALADVAVYDDIPDRAKAFRSAHLVFKDGDLVVRDGKITHYRTGRALTVQPGYDSNIDRRLSCYYDEAYGLSRDLFKVPEHAIGLDHAFEEIACAR
jgi:formylmethanofuran dehydrogenase subunit A